MTQKYKLDLKTLDKNLPNEIKNLHRFVLWRYENVNGRAAKVPYKKLGQKARTNSHDTWDTYSNVVHALSEQEFFSGTGIVLGDGLVGIDLDHVIGQDGNLSLRARRLIDELPGYVERSPSGTGLHVLLKGSLPAPGERKGLRFGKVEFYDETTPRYLTLTGDVWESRSELNVQDASDAIAKVYWKVQKAFNEEKEQARQKSRTGDVQANATGKRFNQGDDGALFERIRNSRQGTKFIQLFDLGDCSGYKSHSEAVAALLWILVWWTGKDEARIDRLFRQSALYDAQKWDRPQNGTTLGNIEIHNACERCVGVYDQRQPKRVPKVTSFINFPDIDKLGKPKATLSNLHSLITHYGIEIVYDEMKQDTFLSFRDGNPYSMDNHREASLGALMSILEQEGIPVRHFEEFICEIADRNRKNPVKAWILSKPWDRTDRLLSLCDTIAAEPWFPDDLKELFIRKWLISAVAAACHDAWKTPFSTRGVLVLAGKQGIGKTRWIRNLAPQEWVCDGVILDPANKDSLIRALSFWIVELGELDSTFRRDIGPLKAFLTKQRDQFRVPYARSMSEYPRRTVFCASVNEPEFLVDRTGNDRFWVIPVLYVRYEHSIDMQQVFAQLYTEWQNGEQWWLTPEESKRLTASNEQFEEHDEVYDLLISRIDWKNFEEKYESGLVEWMTATDVLTRRCGFIGIPTKAQANSCAAHLRKLTGMDSKRIRDASGRNGRAFPIPTGNPL